MAIRTTDLLIVLAYLAAITAFGARFRRGQRNIRDYFLGNRSAPWWALGCSIVATETSTLTIIGTPGIAYAGGLGFLQLVFGYVIARVILCWTLVPRYFRGEFYTAYQLLETRFGVRIKRLAAAIFLATRALAEGVRISAIAKVVSVAFGSGERFSVAVITILTIFYTFEGGMRAVIWTDVAQLALYLIGSLTAFALLFHKIPHGSLGWTHMAGAAGRLRLFDFTLSLTRTYTFWSGVLGGTFLTMASHGTDQTMVQRILAARSQRDGQAALLLSGVIIFVQFALFLLLGVMLFVFYSASGAPSADRDRIFPEFVVHQMPVGITGMVLAAMFAVAMSNASGSLNSLASSALLDLRLGRGTRTASQSELLAKSRKITLLWGLLLGALGLIHWGPVLEAGLTIAAVTGGGLLGVFLLGLWNSHACENGAIAGLLAGISAVLLIHFFTPLAWTWYVLAGTLLTFAAGSLASFLLRSRRRRASLPARPS